MSVTMYRLFDIAVYDPRRLDNKLTAPRIFGRSTHIHYLKKKKISQNFRLAKETIFFSIKNYFYVKLQRKPKIVKK